MTLIFFVNKYKELEVICRIRFLINKNKSFYNTILTIFLLKTEMKLESNDSEYVLQEFTKSEQTIALVSSVNMRFDIFYFFAKKSFL